MRPTVFLPYHSMIAVCYSYAVENNRSPYYLCIGAQTRSECRTIGGHEPDVVGSISYIIK